MSMSCSTMSTALSNVFGGLLAAALLLLEGKRGLHGWQVCTCSSDVGTLKKCIRPASAASFLPGQARRCITWAN